MTSSRFEELERRCAKLKKTRFIRIVFVIAFLFLIAFGSYYWVNYGAKEPLMVSATTTTPQEVALIPAPPILSDQNESNLSAIETAILSQEPKEESLFLAPHIYKNDVKLPAEEAQEAKRSLMEEQSLLKRYNAEQNFANAYALAHFYFERKAYGEVILWAKEASKHDSRSDKSWILYAKAKFYLGERAEAIRSLELFLGYINSKEAQELLNFYKGQE
ncbi:CDC27 family protein [Sulfurospirillum oryzae]|uniref:CDC27 family protein n=1 Tax=Sulfurospirillum oryzae TaxID=2976535 RepID=UPI0021E98987|nr:CDC27 family protein [Sulfurospirillum oryzae]